MSDILQSAKFRYAAKQFDPSRPLADEDIQTLKQILHLSPSSINLQPWHFILATSDEAKAKVAEAAQGAQAYNAQKIKDAGLVVVLCAKTAVNADTIAEVIEQEALDGRYADEQMKNDRKALLTGYLDNLNQDPVVAKSWLDKQTYIALGNVLLAAADMGIDSVPIEGFNPAVVDENFDLLAKGYHSVVLAAFGYRHEDDFNAKLPKSRLPESVIFTEC